MGLDIRVEGGTKAGIRQPYTGGHSPKCVCSKCNKGARVEDHEVETGEIKVTPEGNVVIGVPLIVAFAVPTSDDENDKESN